MSATTRQSPCATPAAAPDKGHFQHSTGRKLASVLPRLSSAETDPSDSDTDCSVGTQTEEVWLDVMERCKDAAQAQSTIHRQTPAPQQPDDDSAVDRTPMQKAMAEFEKKLPGTQIAGECMAMMKQCFNHPSLANIAPPDSMYFPGMDGDSDGSDGSNAETDDEEDEELSRGPASIDLLWLKPWFPVGIAPWGITFHGKRYGGGKRRSMEECRQDILAVLQQ